MNGLNVFGFKKDETIVFNFYKHNDDINKVAMYENGEIVRVIENPTHYLIGDLAEKIDYSLCDESYAYKGVLFDSKNQYGCSKRRQKRHIKSFLKKYDLDLKYDDTKENYTEEQRKSIESPILEVALLSENSLLLMEKCYGIDVENSDFTYNV